jgi:hypothetical protein
MILSLESMNIIKIISINQYILAIYYTSADCYKYSIIDEYGVVLEPDEIFFYTSEAAEREGRKAINTVSGLVLALGEQQMLLNYCFCQIPSLSFNANFSAQARCSGSLHPAASAMSRRAIPRSTIQVLR